MSGAGYESGHVASDHSPIDAMCEVTGGRSYAVTSARVLHQCIESLVQKLQSGVVIHFEKIGSDPPLLPEEEEPAVTCSSNGDGLPGGLAGPPLPVAGPGSRPHTPNAALLNSANNTAWHSCRKLIYVQRSAQKGKYENALTENCQSVRSINFMRVCLAHRICSGVLATS